MEFALIEPGFSTEAEAWNHTKPYVSLLRKTGQLQEGWMITVRQVAARDQVTTTPSWGIYAVRHVDNE